MKIASPSMDVLGIGEEESNPLAAEALHLITTIVGRPCSLSESLTFGYIKGRFPIRRNCVFFTTCKMDDAPAKLLTDDDDDDDDDKLGNK